MADLNGDQCDPLLGIDDFNISSSDPLEVECQDELEKMMKAESIIKMEELEEIEIEEKMASDHFLMSNSVISSQQHQSAQEDPLHVKLEEEEWLGVKIEEDSGPTIKNVPHNLIIPETASHLPIQNQAETVKLVRTFSTAHLKQKQTFPKLIRSHKNVTKLRSHKLHVPKVILVSKSQSKPPNIKRGTSLLKSSSGKSRQPSLNICTAEEILRQSKNHNEKVLRDRLTKDLDMLRDKLAHIWRMNMDNATIVTVLELAKDYCVFLQQQETQLMMDHQVEEVKHGCLKRRLETVTCSLTPLPVEEVPWEEKIKIENVYSTVLRLK